MRRVEIKGDGFRWRLTQPRRDCYLWIEAATYVRVDAPVFDSWAEAIAGAQLLLGGAGAQISVSGGRWAQLQTSGLPDQDKTVAAARGAVELYQFVDRARKAQAAADAAIAAAGRGRP